MKPKPHGNTAPQDKIRTALRRLISEHGVDMATVSRAIGKNHAYIQQYITRGVPAELSYKTALSLAQYFGTSLDMFGIGAGAAKRASNDAGKKQHPVKTIRLMLGLSVSQFADALAIAGQLVQDIEGFKTPLTETLLLRICQTFRVAPDDLREYVPQFSDDERNLIYKLRRMNPAQKQTLRDVLNKIDSGEPIKI